MTVDEFFAEMTWLPPTWKFDKSPYVGATIRIRDEKGKSPIVAIHQRRFPAEAKEDVHVCAAELGLNAEDTWLLIKAEDGRAAGDMPRAVRKRMLDLAEHMALAA